MIIHNNHLKENIFNSSGHMKMANPPFVLVFNARGSHLELVFNCYVHPHDLDSHKPLTVNRCTLNEFVECLPDVYACHC